jgi:hypothetical protein
MINNIKIKIDRIFNFRPDVYFPSGEGARSVAYKECFEELLYFKLFLPPF